MSSVGKGIFFAARRGPALVFPASRTALPSILLVALFSCTRTTELAHRGPDASDTGDLDASDGPPTVRTCVGGGAAIVLGGAGPAACAGAIAARAARFALCSCDDINVPGDLIINSFDAPTRNPGGPQAPPGAGGISQSPWPAGHPVDGLLPQSFFAALGTDGTLQTGTQQAGGFCDVPGSLVVAGTTDVKIGLKGHVLGNAHIAGGFRPKGPYWITGDGYVGGDVVGPITIGGTLHTPASSTISSTVQAATSVREDLAPVAPPCNCEQGPAFDIHAAVEARRTKNDNALLAISPATLDYVDAPLTVDFYCGEYYLDTLDSGSGGSLELIVHGHVGIFVAGEVRLGDTFTVNFADPGSTLDLVVADNFYTSGRVFGSPDAPAATRLWVGSRTISLPNQVQFGAFVYAPDAVLSAGPGLVFSGSLFVRTLSVAQNMSIGFDPALRQAGAECGVAAPDPVM